MLVFYVLLDFEVLVHRARSLRIRNLNIVFTSSHCETVYNIVIINHILIKTGDIAPAFDWKLGFGISAATPPFPHTTITTTTALLILHFTYTLIIWIINEI